jgi:predicted glutamine amidotransferase
VELERRGRETAWDAEFTKLAGATQCQFAIAHNRKASPGIGSNVSAGRAHPFVRKFNGFEVALCHNGFVGAIADQANRENRVDSELFFEQILGGIDRLDFDRVRGRVSHLAREYRKAPDPFTSITAFLLSPTQVFAWRLFGTEPGKPAAAGWYPGYYTLWLKQSEEQALIASEPIDRSAGWELLPNGQCLGIGINDGRITIQQALLDC